MVSDKESYSNQTKLIINLIMNFINLFSTRLAQLVERLPFKPVVVGSSPTSSILALIVYRLAQSSYKRLDWVQFPVRAFFILYKIHIASIY